MFTPTLPILSIILILLYFFFKSYKSARIALKAVALSFIGMTVIFTSWNFYYDYYFFNRTTQYPYYEC